MELEMSKPLYIGILIFLLIYLVISIIDLRKPGRHLTFDESIPLWRDMTFTDFNSAIGFLLWIGALIVSTALYFSSRHHNNWKAQCTKHIIVAKYAETAYSPSTSVPIPTMVDGKNVAYIPTYVDERYYNNFYIQFENGDIWQLDEFISYEKATVGQKANPIVCQSDATLKYSNKEEK